MSGLDRLFLRLYAANLRRPWRSDPRPAWNDALYTVAVTVGLPIAAFVGSGWSIARDLFPGSVGKLRVAQETGVSVGFVFAFALYFALLMRFSVFKRISKSEILSESPPRRWPLIGAWAMASLCCVVFVVIAHIVHHR